jgi:hypothetical protein
VEHLLVAVRLVLVVRLAAVLEVYMAEAVLV